MNAPMPDLKPRTLMAAGGGCCGCCDEIAVETPQGIFNRDGLSEINYRVGDYARFRASLHAALSQSKYTPLPDLHTRDDGDFTISLIDAFACAADVLTFYQSRIANESWLRTAVERVSLQEMGKLVGYRLRPGVAAETLLAFAMDVPPTPPANLAPEPGNFVTGLPASLVLAKGLKVSSVPGPDEKPQTFELVETLAEARPAWNAIRPWMTEAHLPVHGDREVWLQGLATGLRPGDGLLFAGAGFLSGTSGANWNFRSISAVELDNANARTRVTFARALDVALAAGTPATAVFAMRKRSAVFGSNAPLWRSMDPVFRAGYFARYGDASAGESANDPEWFDYRISSVAATGAGGAVDLDQLQSDIAADVASDPTRRSFAVLARGPFNLPDGLLPRTAAVQAYVVTSTTEVSEAKFALSGKVSRLDLSGPGLDANFQAFVRETSVYARSELLALAERPVTADISGDMMPLAVAPDGLLPGRRLILRGIRSADRAAVTLSATLVSASITDPTRTTLQISPPLADALLRASVVVHANVALASHGESVTQVFGSGNSSQSFQGFEIRQLPLSYRAAANEIGAAAELTVRVGDVAWAEKPTLFGAAATDHVFSLQTSAQGQTFVAFGDGTRGARLPNGVNNIRATYRKGLGTDGNLPADRLTQLLTRPLGLKSVSNPMPTEGGTDPEPASAARSTIPVTTRTLGRAVSVLDYEDFARAFSGIAKAQAAVLQTRRGVTVAVTLVPPDGQDLTPSSPVWQNLSAALLSSGDPYVQVTLLTAATSTFRIGLKVKVDPAYDPTLILPAVEAALRDRFSFDARDLAEPVQQSVVIAVAQRVAGVVAVDLTRLYGGTRPLEQTTASLQPRLLASRMRVEAGVALPSELLTLDPAPFDLLEVMA